jgi:hypothetical protein
MSLVQLTLKTVSFRPVAKPTPHWLCEEANMTDLSEKYRPTHFDEVRGQELAVEWCRNQIRTSIL